MVNLDLLWYLNILAPENFTCQRRDCACIFGVVENFFLPFFWTLLYSLRQNNKSQLHSLQLVKWKRSLGFPSTKLKFHDKHVTLFFFFFFFGKVKTNEQYTMPVLSIYASIHRWFSLTDSTLVLTIFTSSSTYWMLSLSLADWEHTGIVCFHQSSTTFKILMPVFSDETSGPYTAIIFKIVYYVLPFTNRNLITDIYSTGFTVTRHCTFTSETYKHLLV